MSQRFIPSIQWKGLKFLEVRDFVIKLIANLNGFFCSVEIVTTPSSTSEEVRSPLEQKLCQSNDITSSDFTSSQMTSSCGLQGSSDAPKKTTRITRRFGASARKGKIPPNNISLPSSEIRSASNSSTPEATVQSQNFVVTPFFTEYSEPTSTCMRMKTKQSPVSPSEDQIREFIPPILSPVSRWILFLGNVVN